MERGTPARLDASRLLDTYGLLALALGRALAERGHAELVEHNMMTLIDPLYDTMVNSTAAWRLVDFCDAMRRVTGLPEIPEPASGSGQV